MLRKRSPTRWWTNPTPHIFRFTKFFFHISLKKCSFSSQGMWPISSQTSWNVEIVCLCAHLQEQSLGGDVSVKLASLWLVKAAHPTRLRCFLWANGGRSCHSARVSFNSDYAYALSLQKPPLLLINDTLKENHSNTPLPAHRKKKKRYKEPHSANVGK